MQQVLGLDDDFIPQICFDHVWNIKTGHFRPCFLPVLATLPSLLTAIILLGQALRILFPHRPSWTKPFVEPPQEPEVEVELVRSRRWSKFVIALIPICSFGLILQLAACLLKRPNATAYLPILPWLVALLEIIIYHPRKTPYATMFILVANVIVEGILLDNDFSHPKLVRILSGCSIGFGISAILVLLTMPYRDPFLPHKDISPPFATPSSIMRSPEEALSYWQFMTVRWIAPLMSIARKRQLEDEDVWALPYEFQHRILHENFRQLKGTVIRRLLKANGIDLLVIVIVALINQLSRFAAPIFLQLILKSMRDESSNVALKYAVLALVGRLITTQTSVFQLWFGRRAYERSRGEMITMLYEKTLGRQISFLPTDAKKKSAGNGSSNGDANGGDTKKTKSWWSRLIATKLKAPPPVKEPASMGKILNLMRNDVYEVAQRFWEFDALIRKPLSVIVSVALLVSFLGWPSLMAVGLVIFAQVMNAILAKILVYYEKKRRVATDTKLQLISQFVEAIRHLRWYGWQGHWLDRILTARQKELTLRILSSTWNVIISFINTLSYELTPVVAFFAYTVIAKKPLTVDIAFPAMQLLGMMTSYLRDLPNLIIALINAWVAVGRIEDFMAEPDLHGMATEALIGDKLALDHATFAWPGASTPVLRDINISFPEGLTVICGEVGAGKTALLQALLGELDMSEGQLIRPPEPIGYCSQTPWLQSMSIRDNILFSAPYEAERYHAVLDACALTPDLADFQSRDLTLIGENGVGLSGGQRARVALARAVYSRTKILLLDDPLAALDQQTAESIVQNCITGPLLKGRTVVLITHRTDLVFGIAAQIVQIKAGEAKMLDQDDLADSELFFRPGDADESTSEEKKSAAQSAAPDKFIEDEFRAHGGVKLSVYWQYIKAGNLTFWGITIFVLILYRMFAVGEAWVLKSWGEAYNTKSEEFLAFASNEIIYAQHASSSWPFGDLPSPEDDIKPWLLIFFIFAIGQSLCFVASQGMLLVIVYTAAKNMFKDVMEKVAGATFRFYDTTPVGRLMNRMTSDIGVIDGGISQQFSMISWLLISWMSAVVVIASITPAFLVFTVVLAVLYVVIFQHFIPTSQSLRRLEMVSLTPLMSNFGELLNGLATVRAFNAQSRFQDRVIHVVDTFQKMDHFYWSTQAWLMYRYDILSSLATFFLFVIALATDLSPGLTAFALVSATKFVDTTHILCRQYGQLQMEFVSVERVVELLHLEQEPKGTIEPPAWWPSHSGDIVFNKTSLTYAPHLPPALSDVSLTLPAGSKTAIIGRTGSGKSTLALSLLATMAPSSGEILIDNIDLSNVSKQTLRERITFLAQDPVLFPGTLRQNLDPLSSHSDSECTTVLSRVCAKQNWSLDTNIEAGGRNLSQGQRQLVGLARAVLRRSAIIVMDEATASIDKETAGEIERVMGEEMGGSTVVVIAHRVEAVQGAERWVRLGRGRVVGSGVVGEGGVAVEGLLEGEDGEGERDVEEGGREDEEGEG
ncbi:unnamed protein product [Zymoseptoria tritici ST99CH_3D1]|nr:unnamed protein product [Zymoseptoria tritici ST99CH_3D1]